MRVLTANDILSLEKDIRVKQENLDVFAGSGTDKVVIIDRGFKIRHTPSGLIYTVIKVVLPKDGDGVKILCQRPGKKLLIPSNKFGDYERQ